MGWRGTVRSIGAAGRQARLASERRERAVARLHSKASSVLSSLDAEVERELIRIEQYEEKVTAQPVKTLKLSYASGIGWATTPFKEQTGNIVYSINYKVPSQDAFFHPESVDIGGIRLSPRALSVSQYFTAIAVEASSDPGEGGKVLKLVYPNKPESSRIALESSAGEIFNPLDTSLDGRLFAGTKRAGVVTFEPFGEGTEHFDILLEAPARKKGADPETVRIRVTSPAMREEMTACIAGPSILESMTDQLRSTQETAHRDIEEKLKKASSGCAVILSLTVCLATVAVAVTLFR